MTTDHAAETPSAAGDPDTPSAAADADDGIHHDDVQDLDEPGGDEPSGGNREAAKYRTRLRAAETERDTLAAQLRAQRDQLLGAHVDPRLVESAGLDPADAIDPDTGLFDTGRATALAAAVYDTLGVAPGTGKKQPPPPRRPKNVTGDLRSGGPAVTGGSGNGWGGLLDPQRAQR